MENGQIVKGQDHLKEEVYNRFKNLFLEEGDVDEDTTMDFLETIPALILPTENKNLLNPFLEAEITSVIWSIDLDKVPGSDEFSSHFYRACWKIIKKDMIRMITSFQ